MPTENSPNQNNNSNSLTNWIYYLLFRLIKFKSNLLQRESNGKSTKKEIHYGNANIKRSM